MRKARFVLALNLAAAAAAAAAVGWAPNAEAQRREKPVPSVASTPSLDVESAENLYTKLDYEQANALAERLVKQRGLTHDQLVRSYRILAITHAYLDKEDAARDAFFQLLVYAPDFQIDANLGPKVNNPFLDARGIFRSLPTKPGIEVAANVRADGGQLRVTTRDPTHIVKKVVVGYRWASTGGFRTSAIAVGDQVGVDIDAAPAGRTRLDFYAQAFDDRDNAVLEAGSEKVPKSSFSETARPLTDPKPSSSGLLASPVFWIVAGAAVIGGSTALFFALRPDDPPTHATLSPVILCGNDLCR